MHISEYTSRVHGVAGRFRSAMPEHQRLVYAVESVVESALPTRVVSLDEARSFVHDLCMEIEVDVPEVIVKKIGKGFAACASHEAYTIVLGTKSTTTLTLCHELAHLLCDQGEGHHEDWRTTFVRLVRSSISVETAALLHTLYNRCDLPTGWH